MAIFFYNFLENYKTSDEILFAQNIFPKGLHMRGAGSRWSQLGLSKCPNTNFYIENVSIVEKKVIGCFSTGPIGPDSKNPCPSDSCRKQLHVICTFSIRPRSKIAKTTLKNLKNLVGFFFRKKLTLCHPSPPPPLWWRHSLTQERRKPHQNPILAPRRKNWFLGRLYPVPPHATINNSGYFHENWSFWPKGQTDPPWVMVRYYFISEDVFWFLFFVQIFSLIPFFIYLFLAWCSHFDILFIPFSSFHFKSFC